MPNPADESFENLEIYKKDILKNDVFFAMSHGVHRGNLKKGKYDKREKFINNLLKKTPNIKVDINDLLSRVRDEKKKERKENLLFLGLIGSVIVITGIIASL